MMLLCSTKPIALCPHTPLGRLGWVFNMLIARVMHKISMYINLHAGEIKFSIRMCVHGCVWCAQIYIYIYVY